MTSIVLIGPRCAGKTTLGRRLAGASNRALVDLDEAILEQLGATSAVTVFETRGEQAWRDVESQVLARCLERALTESLIVATGGGVVCHEGNRALLQRARARGDIQVVWLRVSPEVSQQRLRRDAGDRPALEVGRDAVGEALDVARAREPMYAAVADTQVDADQDMAQVEAAVLAELAGQQE